MKNFKLSLTTKADFIAQIDQLLQSTPRESWYVNLTTKPKRRSLSANAQQHVWYKQISEATSTDIKTVECECKIDFGLPIILSDPEIGIIVEYALGEKFYRMTREQQVKFISVIQVTSLMSTSQHSQYRDNIIYFWQTAGVNIGYKD